LSAPEAEKPEEDVVLSAHAENETGDAADRSLAEGSGEDPEVDDQAIDPAEAEALEAIVVAAAQFSGPLPPPDILRAYGEVVDGGADRIVSQWERETQHRHDLEDRMADAYIAGMTRAQWMAFAVILVIGAGGLVVVALGHAVAGFAAFFLALAALAASFFRNRGQVSTDGIRPADEGQGTEQD
jgi:uncharacterized membrane protein